MSSVQCPCKCAPLRTFCSSQLPLAYFSFDYFPLAVSGSSRPIATPKCDRQYKRVFMNKYLFSDSESHTSLSKRFQSDAKRLNGEQRERMICPRPKTNELRQMAPFNECDLRMLHPYSSNSITKLAALMPKATAESGTIVGKMSCQ